MIKSPLGGAPHHGDEYEITSTKAKPIASLPNELQLKMANYIMEHEMTEL